MSTDHFVTYQVFLDRPAVEEFASLLQANGIEYLIDDNSKVFDPTFLSNSSNVQIHVKLRKEDFEAANRIQLESTSKLLDSVEKTHYLFRFTDVELLELVAKRDEWSNLDFLLAQKILNERGYDTSSQTLSELRTQRMKELTQGDKSHPAVIVAGYVMALLGGLLGILIGWHLQAYRKTLPDGTTVYGYSADDRKHGKRIVICGLIAVIVFTLVRVFTN